MKNVLIAAFVLATSNVAFAGEYYGDDTLGFISDYQGHQAGYSTINHAAVSDAQAAEFYHSEYYGDSTLGWSGTPDQALADSIPLVSAPAVGSSEPAGILEQLFPNGQIGG